MISKKIADQQPSQLTQGVIATLQYSRYPVYCWLQLIWATSQLQLVVQELLIRAIDELLNNRSQNIRVSWPLNSGVIFFFQYSLSRFPFKIPVSYDLEPSLCLLIERVPLYSVICMWVLAGERSIYLTRAPFTCVHMGHALWTCLLKVAGMGSYWFT